jgi:hypothetical protein
MTFLLPAELLDDADRSGLQVSEKGARIRNAVHQLLHPAGNARTALDDISTVLAGKPWLPPIPDTG